MKSVPCDLCGGTEHRSLWKRGRFGLDVSTVCCERCGLVFTNPRMAEDELLGFYRRDYRLIYDASKTPTAQFIALARRQAADRLNHLLQSVNIAQVHQAFEIGCSVGCFLELLRKHSVKTLGFEPADSHARYARDILGLEVRNTFFESSLIAPGSMGLACLFHVLEHLESPKNTLEVIHELLAPDGLIYVESPDIEQPYWGNLDYFFQNAHFYNFSVRTLSDYFSATGYTVINVVRLVEGKFIRIIGRRMGKPQAIVFPGNPAAKIQRDLLRWRWKWLLWYKPKVAMIQAVRKAAKAVLQRSGILSKIDIRSGGRTD